MPRKLSIRPFDSKFNSLSSGLAKSPLYDILHRNTKTAEYRSTEHPRSSRSDRSIANSILYHLGSPNHDSTTFMHWNIKTVEYRTAGRPRSSRSDRSIANSILYRLGSPNHHSTTFYLETHKRLNTELQSVPEALDRTVR